MGGGIDLTGAERHSVDAYLETKLHEGHRRDRGITVLDLGGGGDYSLKYGPRDLTVTFLRRCVFPGSGALRRFEKVYRRGDADARSTFLRGHKHDGAQILGPERGDDEFVEHTGDVERREE